MAGASLTPNRDGAAGTHAALLASRPDDGDRPDHLARAVAASAHERLDDHAQRLSALEAAQHDDDSADTSDGGAQAADSD